ncbi:MAG: shufflon system plasmid conjugative transfer pilus tip adhesin PilV [Chitinophaga sp.]|uniref:tail fiber domain-containing protein n=1 Tax=Chitinophaga sp. TaxID=1869181 RepID=UPI0025BB583D|nr:shufflon system plasmid conjugative transfer pilus tip adhesin PilV [Chitinophaga sp.]MBV8255097.1 shufflon system plasmid conjugative transfer pilus tip adhesin PilV [Chitinophaga sp.]
MKKLISLFIPLLIGTISYAQKVYQIRADSVRIYNVCDTAELILENRTQGVNGYLYNKGAGRTEFRKIQLKKIGTSQIAIVGQDTLDLSTLPGIGGIDSLRYESSTGIFYAHKSAGGEIAIPTGLVDDMAARYTKKQTDMGFIQASPSSPQSAGFSLSGVGTFYNSSSTFDPVNNSSIMVQNNSSIYTGGASIAFRAANYRATSWIAAQTGGVGPGRISSLNFGNDGYTLMSLWGFTNANTMLTVNGQILANGPLTVRGSISGNSLDVADIRSNGLQSGLTLADRYFAGVDPTGSNTNRWSIVADTERLSFLNNNIRRNATNKAALSIAPSNSIASIYNVGINVLDPQSTLDVRGEDMRLRGAGSNSSLLVKMDAFSNGASIQSLDSNGVESRSLYLNPAGGDVVAGDQIIAKGLSFKTATGSTSKLSLTAATNGDAVSVNSEFGSVTMGCHNNGWAHFETTNPRFYFDKEVAIKGILRIYDSNTTIERNYVNIHAGEGNGLRFWDGSDDSKIVLSSPAASGYTSPSQYTSDLNMYFIMKGLNRGFIFVTGDNQPKVQIDKFGLTSSDWLRVRGDHGLYFEDFGGGFYMTDNEWIRTYNGKSFLVQGGTLRADGEFHVGQNGYTMRVPNNGDPTIKNNVIYHAGNLLFSTSATPNYLAQRDASGSLFASGFYQSSKASMKKNIADFNEAALPLLNKVQIKQFVYKDDKAENLHFGIIADSTDWHFATRNQDKFDTNSSLAITMKAVQELSEQNKTIVAENAALKDQNEVLKSQMVELLKRLENLEKKVNKD